MPGMMDYPEIRCQRGSGHDHHRRMVQVDLSQPHRYADLSPVPADLGIKFQMAVWDPEVHPVDDGPYCPAHDAVSTTIVETGIWEPDETILVLRAVAGAGPGDWFVDIGAQIGWFSLLAAYAGLNVAAIDADKQNLRMLTASMTANGWPAVGRTDPQHVVAQHMRIDSASEELAPTRKIRVAKIDVEGAEQDAVRVLQPSLAAGLVDFIMIETTPAWGDYAGLIAGIADTFHYHVFQLPDKHTPPHVIDGTRASMLDWGVTYASIRDAVDGRDQQDLWLVREGVEW